MYLQKGLAIALAAVIAGAQACDDGPAGHSHSKRMQKSATKASGWPTVPLNWGELNILQTTDTHGWLLGHLHDTDPDPNYSGDFGDLASFMLTMKKIALEKGVDLLLLDSGDLHDGGSLSDADPVVNGHTSSQFFNRVPYDVMAIGNHELYIYNKTLDMHQSFVPSLPNPEIYLSSNANISIIDDSGNNSSVPVGGNRYRKFTTLMGKKVTAFGIIFDFTGNDANTTVQPPAELVKEQWFLDALKDEPDVFLLAGHMAVSDKDWETVFKTVRSIHPTTPILILGGHFHIRDCKQFDGRSMSLASGRYMETVGWMSVSGLNSSDDSDLTFSRRYLDANRNTYEFHTRSHGTFDQPTGKKITKEMAKVAKDWNITFQFGEAPQTYWLDRYAPNSTDSFAHLLTSEVFPTIVVNPERNSTMRQVIANSGGMRFDIYEGPFTLNDVFVALPFTNKFLYFADIPYSVASQVLDYMNEKGASQRKRSLEAMYDGKDDLVKRGEVDHIFSDWKREMYSRSQTGNSTTTGYVTHDACPNAGPADDVLHAAAPVADTPDYIGTSLDSADPDTPVDVVFYDFFVNDVVAALTDLSKKTFNEADAKPYVENIAANTILKDYAQIAWNK